MLVRRLPAPGNSHGHGHGRSAVLEQGNRRSRLDQDHRGRAAYPRGRDIRFDQRRYIEGLPDPAGDLQGQERQRRGGDSSASRLGTPRLLRRL